MNVFVREVKLNESAAARRRVPVELVALVDGYTAQTGVLSPTLKWSKNGGAQASGSGTWSEIGDGSYYYEAAQSEYDTLGWAHLHVAKSGCRDFKALSQVVAFDPYDAVRLGVSALPGYAAGSLSGVPTANVTANTVDANLTQSLGVALTNEDFTLASGTASSIFLPSTDSAGTAIPDNGQFQYVAFQVVAGSGAGQVVLASTAGTGPREYNVLSGTMPAQLGPTSKMINVGPWRSNVSLWAGGAAGDLYTADVEFTRDQANTQDEYTVSWFKNGVRVTSSITSPTIQVIKRADGGNLVAGTSMTQIGGTGSYKYDSTGAARQTVGEAVLVVVTASIDGSTRSFSSLVGRDSS